MANTLSRFRTMPIQIHIPLMLQYREPHERARAQSVVRSVLFLLTNKLNNLPLEARESTQAWGPFEASGTVAPQLFSIPFLPRVASSMRFMLSSSLSR